MKQKLILLILGYFSVSSLSFANETELTVYKTPSCGCCQKWIDHLTENGIRNKVISLDDLHYIKVKNNIQGRYQSCHTGVLETKQGNYVFEGHIPSRYIKRFIENPPKGAIGLSVPGMPAGSPGMEMGDRQDYYQVLLLNADGSSSVYAHVNQK